ncbi:hypothetical protein [Pseudomonas sp. CCC3.1]|uniref:hypothetical protein n=1 Tax=Pseudomonas sp. CCC3.1 TaxID=3048607 RepID=UPI002AC95C96|nr:hypothetical protein [Pseudomonas sp. CCC3.1]MEB0207708.1 hypothetical protein [Pseudomonas sp. CCC3.1]WPX37897.1 hypothetical protein RHM56_06860 [Pseudomonas sp. CCC3.1]
MAEQHDATQSGRLRGTSRLFECRRYWCEMLEQPYRYPENLQQFHAQYLEAGQQRELTCLHAEDYLGLQQDAGRNNY